MTRVVKLPRPDIEPPELHSAHGLASNVFITVGKGRNFSRDSPRIRRFCPVSGVEFRQPSRRCSGRGFGTLFITCSLKFSKKGCPSRNYPYLCSRARFPAGGCRPGIKRELLCKSGTMPVAVSSENGCTLFATVPSGTGRRAAGASQKTCLAKQAGTRGMSGQRRNIFLLFTT